MRAACGAGASAHAPEGVPLFNGKDLTGWHNINCAPGTWSVKDGAIHSTGAPICELRTERMYENFVLDVEWMHLTPKGNAGVFIWADPLPRAGSRFCAPSKCRCSTVARHPTTPRTATSSRFMARR